MEVLLEHPPGAWCGCVLAHGAGAGMRHPFLAAIARELAARGMATLRYEFPYMEKQSNRTDTPEVAAARVRAAVAEGARRLPGLPLIAGGKSFGGRMTSTAQAAEPLPGVRGLLFLGFPLHPPGRPSTARAEHLTRVAIPMLFLQGTRDEFASLELLQPVLGGLGAPVTLHLVDSGDHSFKVPRAAGRDAAAVMGELADAIVAWARALTR